MTRIFHRGMEATVTLEWDLPPEDGGAAAIVNKYTIFISPAPASYPSINVSSPPWNVTLSHNTPYNVSITATNCAGDSEPTILPGLLYFG